jgi:hypothetical protein
LPCRHRARKATETTRQAGFGPRMAPIRSPGLSAVHHRALHGIVSVMPGAKAKIIDGNGSKALTTRPRAHTGLKGAELISATKAFRFRPGVSGNPRGFSKFYHEARKIARDASPEMMRVLVALTPNEETDERVRSVSAVAFLDRAGIKPMDYDPLEDRPQPGLDLGKLTAEDRDLLKAMFQKMAG